MPRLILISGFTAAGKTTHARLLARDLGWQYIGMAELRSGLISSTPGNGREWSPEIDFERSQNPDLDLRLDKSLRDLLDRSRHVVVDAWVQPWLNRAHDALRVWIHSDTRSRLDKAVVSYLRDGIQPPPDLPEQIKSKDHFSLTTFKKLYGIEFGPDRTVFQLCLDNSNYITSPSVEASDRGIQGFHDSFIQAVHRELS